MHATQVRMCVNIAFTSISVLVCTLNALLHCTLYTFKFMAVQKLRFAACSASADSIWLILRNRTWRCALLCRQKPSSSRAFDCRCSSLAANILRDFAGVGCASMKYSFFYWKIKWVTSKSRLSCISLYWKKKSIFSILFSYFIFFSIYFCSFDFGFSEKYEFALAAFPECGKFNF